MPFLSQKKKEEIEKVKLYCPVCDTSSFVLKRQTNKNNYATPVTDKLLTLYPEYKDYDFIRICLESCLRNYVTTTRQYLRSFVVPQVNNRQLFINRYTIQVTEDEARLKNWIANKKKHLAYARKNINNFDIADDLSMATSEDIIERYFVERKADYERDLSLAHYNLEIILANQYIESEEDHARYFNPDDRDLDTPRDTPPPIIFESNPSSNPYTYNDTVFASSSTVVAS